MDNLLQKILGENSGHIGNGLIGGQWLMRTLTANGHGDVAYTLASQSTYPGWGYMVKQGATTIWELWNGDRGDPGMNSGNHVMLLGDLITWYYENLAGIKPDPAAPGFSHIIMKPYVLGDLTHVDASCNSVSGKIQSAWKMENGKFCWNVTIPANTTATISVPTLNNEEVTEGNKKASDSNGIRFIKWENDREVFEIKSGNYSFSSNGVKKIVTGSYLSAPVITPKDTLLITGSKLNVTLNCADAGAKIRYTTDGSEISDNSPVYDKPLEITSNTIVMAQAFLEGAHSSNQSKMIYNYIDPVRNGISWSLFKGTFTKVPDFDHLKPGAKGTLFQFGLPKTGIPRKILRCSLYRISRLIRPGNIPFS